MKYLPLFFANVGRKKLRTILTLGTFAVAFFLFGVLVAIHGAFVGGAQLAGADRLVVINRASLTQFLPLSYRDRLARMPGITHVTFATWFGGVYQDERNFFPQFAIDAPTQLRVFDENVVPDAEWRAFLADKAGCIAGASLVERFGWKIGDRIPIKGTIFPGLWEFNLRGVFRGRRPQDDTTQFWFRSDHLEERKPQWFKGYVGWYTVRIADPGDAARLVREIDATFANSTWETRTQTEKAMAASFVKQVGNIELILLSVGGVVFFTLLFVTGNTMAITVRERTSELAVLKALGFSDGSVLRIVLGEALALAACGGASGLALAKLLSLRGDPTGGMLSTFYVGPVALGVGWAIALGVGLLAGLVPAFTAMRLGVATALRRA